MKLRVPEAIVLFVIGGVAALIGDHSHVATDTTVYYTDTVPFVWSSPFWFPILVGTATVSVAELRMHLREPRPGVTGRQALAGVATVVGMYVTTALLHGAPVAPTTALICAAAVVIWCVVGDGAGAVCGAIISLLGPIVEIVLVNIGVFAYNPPSDSLFGVGPFLVPLYFAFGAVVAVLGEFAVLRRSHLASPACDTIGRAPGAD